MRFFPSAAYTLVELLIALTLSLLLLLGVAELFQRVGGAMNETRSVMSASAHLNEAALLLRQDLARIPKSLADKPERIAKFIDDLSTLTESPSDEDGYLEIIEGAGTLAKHPYVNESGEPDITVGDVDDIIAFTTASNSGMPFRGVIREKIVERDAAEIVWFVRGNTLYRRQRLIDDVTRNENNDKISYKENEGDIESDFPTKAKLDAKYPKPEKAGQFAVVEKDETTDGGEQRYDAVEKSDGFVWTTLLSHSDLARRARRFGHDGLADNHRPESFPYPLYAGENAGWYYLRMPTIEETDHWSGNNTMFWKTDSTVPKEPAIPKPDLWNQPHFFPELQDRKSGSLNECVTDPRNPKAGEDAVLTNVLSFDVKVWDPTTKDFVDLGTEGTIWAHANNKQDKLQGVWDSWTQQYKDESAPQPPYAHSLEAIRITIRCFEPASGIVKQVTVVHRFL
jgi:type II secretory pathway pseudopilin PulG